MTKQENSETVITDDFTFDGEYNKYVIIVFGLRFNIKFFETFTNKNDAIKTYGEIFTNKNMMEKDNRGLNILQGEAIYGGFNNDYGIITMIGYNCMPSNIYIGFAGKTQGNFITISILPLDDSILFHKKKYTFSVSDKVKLK